MIGITIKGTTHGNPCEHRILHKGTKVKLVTASNMPDNSPIKYWAHPLSGHLWPKNTMQWSKDVGVGLHEDDVILL